MSEGNGHGKEFPEESHLREHSEAAEEGAPDDVVTLSISYSPSTGQLGIYGPIRTDPIMCMGLLDMAKFQILARQESESRIIRPTGGIPPHLVKGG